MSFQVQRASPEIFGMSRSGAETRGEHPSDPVVSTRTHQLPEGEGGDASSPPVGPTAQPVGDRARWHELLRFGRLQRRLFAIVFVGLLPVAILAFATLVYTANKQRDQVIAAADNALGVVLNAVDAEVAATWASLDALAASPRLGREDWLGFHSEANELLARRSTWANVVLSTPQAEQVVNARLPYGTALPQRVDPETIEAAARTGVPQVGNVVFGPGIQGYGFGVAVPVKRGRDVVYVLSVPVKPDAVRSLLAAQRVPDQGVVAVVDRRFNVVARSRNNEGAVGKPSSSSLIELLTAGGESGWGISNTLEGVPVYTIYRRDAVTGWYAAIGLPTALLDGPLRRSYLALGGAVVLSVLLGLAASLLIARSVTRPMRELERAAAAAAQGELPPQPRTALPEVQKVAAALTAAHLEREKLLDRERDARVAAEEASRAKDELLAMLGHELRNPLAAISNAAQILERADASGAPQLAAEAKSIIRRQALHLGRITDDLLDTGRAMMGKITLNRTPIDLARLVQRTAAMLRDTGRLGHHRVQVDATSAWIEADPTRMEQVISNLLGNAVKYTPSGGEIFVTVAREGARAVLRVRDRGIGLEPELLPRVFDLFVQGPRSIDRADGGLGIGLTLVRRIVHLHGGRVEARSEGVNKGSEFVVELPAIDAPAREAVVRSDLQPSGAATVVIVEDNADARTSLRHLLEFDGHEVHEAADGPSGVATILRVRPDVALVDIGLPGLDGHGVARAVRAELEGHVTLVAVTGYGQRDAAPAGSAFDDYLVKPVDPEELGQIVTRGARARTMHDGTSGAPAQS